VVYDLEDRNKALSDEIAKMRERLGQKEERIKQLKLEKNMLNALIKK
jgi:uncharacterized protein involved in exopolysaccharide biosynthesis